MSNTNDSTEKMSNFTENIEDSDALSSKELINTKTLSDTDDEEASLSTEKADGPASEVADFQDAASSMRNMAPEALPEHEIFTGEEMNMEIETSEIDPRQSKGGGRRSRYQNGRAETTSDVLINRLLERASRAHPTLREQLRGSVIISIDQGRERYLFDWTSECAKACETKQDSADCTIHLQSSDLLCIAQGSLNPQIAMLSDKVQIEGNVNLAMYFFNLVAPPMVH
ncbi:MAG: SCP2 sterol-binding domain-containing protein [SAR324 cluster bacterium]|uniref:SCP2 sterol-binding domain-containing protein n=1 Tax=SAR324 cluster bacterium TaxID=2024889 RepID=A0A7X9FQB9_9DELT|nr:SCP2 sterol-binding domain-containing protein [SAR324 cluster bacterium]